MKTKDWSPILRVARKDLLDLLDLSISDGEKIIQKVSSSPTEKVEKFLFFWKRKVTINRSEFDWYKSQVEHTKKLKEELLAMPASKGIIKIPFKDLCCKYGMVSWTIEEPNDSRM